MQVLPLVKLQARIILQAVLFVFSDQLKDIVMYENSFSYARLHDVVLAN